MLIRTFPYKFSLLLALLSGCGVDAAVGAVTPPNEAGAPGDGGQTPAACAYGQIVCEGSEAKVCDGQGGFTANVTHCAIECQDGLGCVHCMPNAASCADGVAKVCDASGSSETVFACTGDGMQCQADGCKGACSPQALGTGSQGCEFWPTVTSNPVWSGGNGRSGFHFGLLLGNVSSTSDVTVTIARGEDTDGDGGAQQVKLNASEVRVVPLDWVTDLKGFDWTTPFVPDSSKASVLANGAYHVLSNAPIIAYQFSPVEDKLVTVPGNGCPMLAGANSGCYSFSTDASLLMPAHVLSKRYMATGYHAWHEDPFAGAEDNQLNQGDFLAITATQPDTALTLTLRSGQTILPGEGPWFGDAGRSFTLAAGDVLQVFTSGHSGSDTFSGTLIESSQPVQVLSGVSCASIPQDKSPCGHVEDPVLPLAVLGKDYVLPTLHAPSGASIARSLRIQAVVDGTALSFTPTTFNNVTLNAGEVLDIPDVTVNVSISSKVEFAVTEYMNGRGSISSVFDGQNVGGPAQWSVPPTSQFRTDYVFMGSPTFEVNVASIVAATGAQVTLDGKPVPPESFMAVEKSGMSVARQPLLNNTEVHRLHADKPVGLSVYGFSPFTNYMLSAGLDFRVDAVPVH